MQSQNTGKKWQTYIRMAVLAILLYALYGQILSWINHHTNMSFSIFILIQAILFTLYFEFKNIRYGTSTDVESMNQRYDEAEKRRNIIIVNMAVTVGIFVIYMGSTMVNMINVVLHTDYQTQMKSQDTSTTPPSQQ